MDSHLEIHSGPLAAFPASGGNLGMMAAYHHAQKGGEEQNNAKQ